MISFNKQRIKFIFIGLLSSLSLNAIAQDASENTLCPFRKFKFNQGGVTVWQKQFEDGVYDLVISPITQDGLAPIVRLSFGGSKEAKCHFPEVSLLKGGDWGWHVAWTSLNHQAIFYVRVDAEAWVSSPPKKMRHEIADVLQLSEAQGILLLQYHLRDTPAQENHIFASEDEGRNFSVLDKK